MPGINENEIYRFVIMSNDRAVNGSGIRDTARVLKISPITVINELKKRDRASTRSTVRC